MIGTSRIISSMTPASACFMLATIGVSMIPGATAFTRMPRGIFQTGRLGDPVNAVLRGVVERWDRRIDGVAHLSFVRHVTLVRAPNAFNAASASASAAPFASTSATAAPAVANA